LVFLKDSNSYYNFAYKYREGLFSENKIVKDGWKIYDPIQEYLRQGIDIKHESSPFKLSNLNKNYSLCSTYPEILIFPRSVSDEDIKEASLFRTKNRLPILSYLYSRHINDKASNASIWRSSQPKSGISSNRSIFDEKLLKQISKLNEKLVIYDARPYLNAQANRVYRTIFIILD
jgi:hypothetical protein